MTPSDISSGLSQTSTVDQSWGCVVNKVDFNSKYGYGGYYKSYQSYSIYGLDKQGKEMLVES